MGSYKPQSNLPLVVICGRTNVGKSTLFNSLVGRSQALVSSIDGTTRDSNLGVVEWANSAFEIVDTAGILEGKYQTYSCNYAFGYGGKQRENQVL